eukprot:1159709-Pelagomonas_calceolata.AAC.3
MNSRACQKKDSVHMTANRKLLRNAACRHTKKGTTRHNKAHIRCAYIECTFSAFSFKESADQMKSSDVDHLQRVAQVRHAGLALFPPPLAALPFAPLLAGGAGQAGKCLQSMFASNAK